MLSQAAPAVHTENGSISLLTACEITSGMLPFPLDVPENNGSAIPSVQEAQDLSMVFSEFHKETLLRPVFPQKQAGHRPHPSEDLSR